MTRRKASPLNGLMAPDASPMSIQFLPTFGPTDSDMGSLPPMARVCSVSSVIFQ